MVALGATLAVVRWSKTAENSMDYSVMNTARQLLWLPTTREEKYKAKQAVDSFFVRFGDVLSALVVYAGTTYLTFGITEFASLNVALVLVWIVVAVLVGREFVRRVGPQGIGATATADPASPSPRGAP